MARRERPASGNPFIVTFPRGLEPKPAVPIPSGAGGFPHPPLGCRAQAGAHQIGEFQPLAIAARAQYLRPTRDFRSHLLLAARSCRHRPSRHATRAKLVQHGRGGARPRQPRSGKRRRAAARPAHLRDERPSRARLRGHAWHTARHPRLARPLRAPSVAADPRLRRDIRRSDYAGRRPQRAANAPQITSCNGW